MIEFWECLNEGAQFFVFLLSMFYFMSNVAFGFSFYLDSSCRDDFKSNRLLWLLSPGIIIAPLSAIGVLYWIITSILNIITCL